MLELNVFKIEYLYLHDALRECHASAEEAYEICNAIYNDFMKSAFNSPYKTFEDCFLEYLNSFKEINVAAVSTCEFLNENDDCNNLNSNSARILVSGYLNK